MDLLVEAAKKAGTTKEVIWYSFRTWEIRKKLESADGKAKIQKLLREQESLESWATREKVDREEARRYFPESFRKSWQTLPDGSRIFR